MTPSGTPLSCYIRTKNEQHNIVATVRAAVAVADEVIVVDSHSTDQTRELAEAEGAKVHLLEWRGNGAQKIASEKLCTHKWLLDIDADETLTSELIEEIRSVFSSPSLEQDAYTIPISHLSPVDGKTVLGVVRKLKIYNREKASPPDNRLESNIKTVKGAKIGHLKQGIRHTMFQDMTDLMAKMNRRSSRNAILARQKPLFWLHIRIWLGLPFYILKNLFTRRMILGGTYGAATATTLAIGRWLRDVKMYEKAHGLDNLEEKT